VIIEQVRTGLGGLDYHLIFFLRNFILILRNSNNSEVFKEENKTQKAYKAFLNFS
jgi:hypothetical protein